MILNGIDQWIVGNFCFDGYGKTDDKGLTIQGTGPKYFLGALTKSERTPIVAIGIVEVQGGWLLFAQDPEIIHRPDADFCLEKYGEGDTDIFAVMTIDTGWEPDVVSDALEHRNGMITRVIREPDTSSPESELSAKRLLHRWVQTLNLTWKECDL